MYIYDVKISGFTRSSIYIYDIIRLRVNVVNKVICKLLCSGVTQHNTDRHISLICFSVVSEKRSGDAEVFVMTVAFITV
jgi:hypothetical protein